MSQRGLTLMQWQAMLLNIGARHLVEVEKNNGRHLTIPAAVLKLIDDLEAAARAEGVTSVVTDSTPPMTPADTSWVSYETAETLTGKSRRTLQRRVAKGTVETKAEGGRTLLRREDLL